jgi:hypothetical protein
MSGSGVKAEHSFHRLETWTQALQHHSAKISSKVKFSVTIYDCVQIEAVHFSKTKGRLAANTRLIDVLHQSRQEP